MEFPRLNLHIHSNYSDGRNSIAEIVKEAISLDLDYIAITDHFSNSWKSDIIKTLDSYTKIQKYIDTISSLNHKMAKNYDKLRILKGIEIDLTSSRKYIQRYIKAHNFDLILFEYLQTPEMIGFVEALIQDWHNIIPKNQNFPLLGLAHLDPSYFIYSEIDVLLNFLKRYQIYFEFNSSYSSYYSTKYENNFFNKLKKLEIPVAVGADSHNRYELNDIDEAMQMIDYYQLAPNYWGVIEKIKEKVNLK